MSLKANFWTLSRSFLFYNGKFLCHTEPEYSNPDVKYFPKEPSYGRGSGYNICGKENMVEKSLGPPSTKMKSYKLLNLFPISLLTFLHKNVTETPTADTGS